MLDAVTSSAPMVWIPHRLSCPPRWGAGSGGTVVLFQGSPRSRGDMQGGGSLLTLAQQPVFV